MGFVANLTAEPTRGPLLHALSALDCIEHRGAVLADGVTGDGAGVMCDIPYALFDRKPGTFAVSTLMLVGGDDEREQAEASIIDTFGVLGLHLDAVREVPTDPRVLGTVARQTLPTLRQLVFLRPSWCRTTASFERLLHQAKQRSRTRLRQQGLLGVASFASLSSSTIVYKALVRAPDLAAFYPDLVNSAFRTRFAVFHRRFSTNTRTSWDKAQPFRLLAHNGEINTIAGNRAWSYSREQALGLPRNELLTHSGVSDSGNFNEMVEALKYRSSIPYVEDSLALMIPPAEEMNNYYRFWSRAAEPWDGPALITYCDGQAIGARVDRNGFRPCRFAMTEDAFFLGSEAGIFGLDEAEILQKGTLRAGSAVKLLVGRPDVWFRDPSHSYLNREGILDPRLKPLTPSTDEASKNAALPVRTLRERMRVFGVGSEEVQKILDPMMATGKEPIGSMGDTSALAVLSDQRRSFFDYFFQTFAQVTNPPLDYLRESVVCDLSVYLGRAPNIFIPKEMIPPREAFLLDSPVIDLGQLRSITELSRVHDKAIDRDEGETPPLAARIIDICFPKTMGQHGIRKTLERIGDEVERATREGATIVVLSDESASSERLPVPSLLALRAAVRRLNREGMRLRTSVVVATGDVRTTHGLACLVGFGAHAVCPTFAFELARYGAPAAATDAEAELSIRDDAEERTARLRQAFEQGLLKIMSKMGISVVRSYMSAKLFTAVGLGDEVIDTYFRGLTSPIGGVGLEELGEQLLAATRDSESEVPTKTYQLKEHNRDEVGEVHSMTAKRSRLLHEALDREDPAQAANDPRYRAYAEYRKRGPVTIRHLMTLADADAPLPLDEVEPREAILKRFSSGSMSFGAISAQSQADIIRALNHVGGRSGSGEGGENPAYFEDGTTASVKQVASARFGVTAEYLMGGDEFEIKIAQGAKPGEGGQLMGVKVNSEIARARYATEGRDLISPPPLHDIYSIEDLKELIYELRQLKPSAKVCVKLVSGANIGTIAMGVVKAGADCIQISGGDGGTGAATVSSMRHAGLPWELGLVEVHQALVENDMRRHVELRVDGGLSSGEDVVMAAIMGAEGFGFGKLLLVAQGCIMARVCEKNTCPRGIATHDPRFLAKYRGSADDVVQLLQLLADDTRRHLSRIGVESLAKVMGQTHLLREHPAMRRIIRERGLSLTRLMQPSSNVLGARVPAFELTTSALNKEIVDDALTALNEDQKLHKSYRIRTTDRAVPARLCGTIASQIARQRKEAREAGAQPERRAFDLPDGQIALEFEGSAGQGFGVFLVAGLDVTLRGEANDSVGKGMSGGRLSILPSERFTAPPSQNAIIGNCALYGATGGEMFVHGRAGDRFAVRNSGATAVVSGVGMHACEYMTDGVVVILGDVATNVGAGMTGGIAFIQKSFADVHNPKYVSVTTLDASLEEQLRTILERFEAKTGCREVAEVLSASALSDRFVALLPTRAPSEKPVKPLSTSGGRAEAA